ncbi:tetratricopeptide repeat protein [Candidatus Electrothrix sp.]|uniref:tetratricopeptide repeat protein n=1 Tax=Candidatus Electrothrix sp. TaxID=2170559 RepID=UPI00405663F5
MYFYNGSPGTFSLNEQLAAEVEKIRILQSKQKFAKALKTANAVLARNPEHPEALYLKAQILSGFGKYSAAHACLNKLIAIKDPAPDEKLRNWAISLRKEVLKRIRERQEPDRELRRKA